MLAATGCGQGEIGREIIFRGWKIGVPRFSISVFAAESCVEQYAKAGGLTSFCTHTSTPSAAADVAATHLGEALQLILVRMAQVIQRLHKVQQDKPSTPLVSAASHSAHSAPHHHEAILQAGGLTSFTRPPVDRAADSAEVTHEVPLYYYEALDHVLQQLQRHLQEQTGAPHCRPTGSRGGNCAGSSSCSSGRSGPAEGSSMGAASTHPSNSSCSTQYWDKSRGVHLLQYLPALLV